MFSPQDIAPQQTSERGTERRAEGAVVHADGHAVYRGPEGPVADGRVVDAVDFLPGLDYAGEEDCCADVCSGELRRNT